MAIDEKAFNNFCATVDNIPCSLSSGNLKYANSKGSFFYISIDEVLAVLRIFRDRNEEIARTLKAASNDDPWEYSEKPYRSLSEKLFDNADRRAFYDAARSQTKPVFTALNKCVGFALGRTDCGWNERRLLLDRLSLEKALPILESLPTIPRSSPARGVQEAAGDIAVVLESICDFCDWDDQFKENRQRILLHSPEGRARVAQLNADLEALASWLHATVGIVDGVRFSIKPGSGSGRTAHVPWVCALPPNQTVSRGVYVALCFGRHGEGFVCGFAQSATSPHSEFDPVIRTQGPMKVDVNGDSAKTHYNDVFANPIEVLVGEVDIAKLRQHLLESAKQAIAFLGLESEPERDPEEIAKAQADLLPAFLEELADQGLVYRTAVVRRFLLALVTKPFVILTGNSGSGKTKLARTLGKWMSDLAGRKLYSVIPVGADWTDNRKVVGFINAFREHRLPDGKEVRIYNSTPILELLLDAIDHPTLPHFLVLDEMNLSHVERYFSDFLSAMESGEELVLHNEEGEVQTTSGRQISAAVSIPRNLFVVGTVNVDETTYMFSPKVLDRANVIEVRAAANDVFHGPPGLEERTQWERASVFPLAFQGLADSTLDSLPTLEDLGAEPAQCFRNVFSILGWADHEFGFRTAKEIARFVEADTRCGWLPASGPLEALDAQVLQKLLPRLHGSRRKLEPVLAALTAYCNQQDLTAARAAFSDPSSAGHSEEGSAVAALTGSHEKLRRMLNAIRRDQFVSFIA